MKNLKLLMILFSFIVLQSCSKNDKEQVIDENEFNYEFDIKSIEPLTGDLSIYEKNFYTLLKSHGYDPDFENSEIVTYSNSDVKTIFTPIVNSLKDDSNITFMFFELDNDLIDFDLIISETIINDAIGRYAYLDVDGQVLFQFDVQLEDGLVLEVITPKSWGNRWQNCVTWTLQQMTYIDYLACMAVGKYCAGGIAALCAFAATEGYFESPEGP